MVDLSKLPWGELKLPGDLIVSHRRGTLCVFPAIFKATLSEMLAWNETGRWRLASIEADDAIAVIRATELVDAFIEQHSKPKLPDVMPPEGMRWIASDDVVGGKAPALVHADVGCTVVSSVPTSEKKRNAMLACCEAADINLTTQVAVHDTGLELKRWVDISPLTPSQCIRLKPGRYAVSFRRLPDGK